MDMKLSARKLDKMIEEATVDCYDELEQASGFYTMIEDHLAVPFATQVLGWGIRFNADTDSSARRTAIR